MKRRSVVALNQTPFYAESGGQVGDIGTLVGDGVEFIVADTQKDGDLLDSRRPSDEGQTRPSARTLSATVDESIAARAFDEPTRPRTFCITRCTARSARMRLSEAPRSRRMSCVSTSLTIRRLTADELRQVEDIINECIARGATVTTELLPIEAARKKGAMALFGEKYPDEVRSRQHGRLQRRTLRRNASVEHRTGRAVPHHFRRTDRQRRAPHHSDHRSESCRRKVVRPDELVAQLQRMLKAPQAAELPAKVEALQNEVKALSKQLSDLTSASVADAIGGPGGSGRNDQRSESHREEAGRRISRNTCETLPTNLRDKHSPIALILGAEIEGKVSLIAGCQQAAGQGQESSRRQCRQSRRHSRWRCRRRSPGHGRSRCEAC